MLRNTLMLAASAMLVMSAPLDINNDLNQMQEKPQDEITWSYDEIMTALDDYFNNYLETHM